MQDQSSYTAVFRGTTNPNDHRKAKRNRQPLSCSACRLRKLRCSRQHPCEACVKRDEGSTCDIKTSASNPAAVPKTNGKGKKARAEAQARLQNLEEMVNKFIQSGAAPTFATTSSSEDSQRSELEIQDASAVYSSLGGSAECLSKAGDGLGFVGATHWATILGNIKGIHKYLDSDNELEEEFDAPDPNNVDFLLGPIDTITMADVLSFIPPRAITDTLMSVYFDAGKLIVVSWLHTTKFRREYEAFWANPDSMSFIWISSLFSILSIAARVAIARQQEISGFPPEDFSPLFLRTRASQCLVAGNYQKPQPYVIESLLLYMHSALLQDKEEQNRSWSILNVTIRLAQRMGYHRDPQNLPSSESITPYEAEMRRRVWMFVEYFDVYQSIKLGLPTIVHDEECDTQPPRNLWDEDFDETSITLPPSRPYTEATPMLLPCYKVRYIRPLRRISRLAMSIQRPHYNDLMRTDAELRQIHNEIPPSLKIRPIKATSVSDESIMIMKRLIAELLYLKCLCILHRAYLTCERGNHKFEPSRKACKEAALQILDIQIEAYRECLPGGRLFEQRWTIFSSTLYDFLLAATIVCLDVYEGETTR